MKPAFGLVAEWAALDSAELLEGHRFGADMLKHIVSANPLGGHRLHVRFEDGVQGVVDLDSIIISQV